MSADGLLNTLKDVHVIRCDEAAWRLFGLSFAGYNALISLGLAVLALLTARQLPASQNSRYEPSQNNR
jgi:disulfide bond formation protein DsbB